MMRSPSVRPSDSSVSSHAPRHAEFAARTGVTGMLIVLIGMFGQGVAHGQGAWSGVNTDLPGAEGDSLYPVGVSADAVGNVMTVWGGRTPHAVRAARYSAATGTWSNPIDLALNERTALFPVMTGDQHGNVVAAWITNARPRRVQVARYSAASDTWDAPLTLAQALPTSGDLADLAIAGNNSGDVVLVWTRQLRFTAGSVQAARYAPATGSWLEATDMSVGAQNYLPRIALDAAGNAVAMWCGTASGAPVSQTAHNTAATTTWSSPSQNTDVSCGSQFKADGAGNAMAIWVAQQGAEYVLKGARYSAGARTWSEAVSLSPAAQYWIDRPDLVIDSQGNAMAIWLFQASTGRGVYARRYEVASNSWNSGTTLVSNTAEYGTTTVSVDASGNFTAAWTVGTGNSGLHVARRPAGGTWGAPVLIASAQYLYQSASQPQLAADPAGNVTLLWSFYHSPAVGAELQSTRWLAAGVPTGPPGAPVNLRASLSGSTLSLTWNPPTTGGAPTSYGLVGRLTAGGPVLAAVPMGAARSFSVTAPNGTFVLSVRAANANGAGPESASVTVTIPEAGPPPGPPSNLAANVTGTTANFAWSPPSSGGAVRNYVLVAGLTPGFSVPYATVPIGATAGLVVPGAPAGTFYLRVLAQNAGGTSAPSNEVAFTVAGATPPAAPTLNAPTVSGSTVSLSWSPGSGAAPTGYTLAGSLTPGGAPIATVPLSGTSVSFAGIPSGTFYLWLTASNAAGTSPSSAEVTLTVP